MVESLTILFVRNFVVEFHADANFPPLTSYLWWHWWFDTSFCWHYTPNVTQPAWFSLVSRKFNEIGTAAGQNAGTLKLKSTKSTVSSHHYHPVETNFYLTQRECKTKGTLSRLDSVFGGCGDVRGAQDRGASLNDISKGIIGLTKVNDGPGPGGWHKPKKW